ncbi:Uncharacterised protein [Moraxella atlantae]|uniref:Tc1-like transposase DDE domain-containing protein n=1 Tax=Faucicola atlantae TaxID=34059 RepID=A0A378Q0Z4_9GAMM|nr:transposase [Moraxella atlantae]STY94345.1 Uncharacterised protein [Moraxella atlantae]
MPRTCSQVRLYARESIEILHYYTRSWSPIGKPCYAKIDANKGKRLNLMGAMRLNEFKLIAPITFEGGCKRVTVEDWLHTLAQSLPKDENGNYPKRVLVLDNVY